MARYFLRFRHSDTGLTPTYNFFKKASDLTVVTPPAIGEVGSGTYYFDYSPTFDIVFEVDGGPSIPTEEVRYIADTISPKDVFVDEPTSQVKDDVWNDMVDRAALTKGDYVEKLVGMETSLADIKGAGFATGTDSLKILSDVADDIKGAGFVTGTDSLRANSVKVDAINIETDPTNIANAVWDATTTGNITPGTMGGLVDTGGSGGGAPSAATNAAAVWNEALAGHVTAGSAGVAMKNSFKILKNRTKINTTLDTLTVYDDDGVSVLYVFNLKDAAGAPSGETPFERVP